LKDKLKENENLYDKFDEYLKEASGEVPKKLIMIINSRRNSFQQDEDMSIAMENVVANEVKISNYKALAQVPLRQASKAQ
jgi:hypothetical protein